MTSQLGNEIWCYWIDEQEAANFWVSWRECVAPFCLLALMKVCFRVVLLSVIFMSFI